MSKTPVFLLDNNVLSDYAKHSGYTERELKRIGVVGTKAVCIVNYLEFMDGIRDKDLYQAKKFLETLEFVSTPLGIDEVAKTIAHKGFVRNEKHAADCMVAAIAIVTKLPLVTANVKDFKGLHKDLQLIPYTQYSTYLREQGRNARRA